MVKVHRFFIVSLAGEQHLAVFCWRNAMGRKFLGPPPPYKGATFLKNDPLASDVSLMSPTVRRDNKSRLIERLRQLWVPDILWCLVGLGCGAAIVGVLAHYDGERPPQWALGITLNTFLAFLATVAKASLLIPVTRGLGQLRWVWFSSGPRRADDFELFEGATRGAFGSLRFLVSLKGGYVIPSKDPNFCGYADL
jgi:hypothetical protein